MANPKATESYFADRNNNPIFTDRQTNVAKWSVTAGSGSLITADGSTEISTGGSATNAELEEAVMELKAVQDGLIDCLIAHGLMAES